MRIVVVGVGYMGLTTAAGLASFGHTVVGVDVDEQKLLMIEQGELPFTEPGLKTLVQEGLRQGLTFSNDLGTALKDADVCFICVGTPALPTGGVNMAYMIEAAGAVRDAVNDDLVVVDKSTVPVGTARKVREIIGPRSHKVSVVSNPEFLREGSAMNDFLHPDRIIIGSDDDWATDIMKEIYKPFGAPILIMSPESAELTKYAANGFLATKISFINEIANICDRVGADVRDVAEGIGLDKRIGKDFLQAGVGYGGSCFPKDTSALRQIAGECDYDFQMLATVIEVNRRQRDEFASKVGKAMGGISGKRIGVWGLAFKAHTDDVRESAAIDIIERLIKLGASVVAYDPEAVETARLVLGDRIEYAPSALDAARGAEALLILTEWPQFRDENFMTVKNVMRAPLILDGRNLLADMDFEHSGIRYYGIGLGRSD